ncbi:uncharacterized protein LOC135702333 [Ochlerotatus camptorhynchus]|uniref:uncharacterized protein LOC135702333 n=1 Tax=Ochlerotatus camptorhynchus TaxID=644619 RepID=UPI0031E245F1
MSTSSLVRPGLTTAIVGHLPAIKLRLRRKVPQLTFQDVRRVRARFYEALASELYESGCPNAAFLLLQLIEFEHDHVPQTSDSTIEEKRLKNSKNLLNFLTESLRVAEGHKNEQRYADEVEHLLMIGRSLQDDRHKRWIARQFFLISLDRCTDCQLEGSWIGTKTKYYYGMFLNTDKNLDEAVEMLETAENWARGQNWAVEKEKGALGSQLLTTEIYHQLYLAYSGMCDRFKRTDAEKFDLYMQLSHEAAIKCNLKHVLCDSYLNYGDFQLDQGSYHQALDSYRQALRMAKSIKATDKDCKIHIRMAAVYRSLHDPKECEYWMNIVDKMTADDRTSECYAELRMFNGEIHFANGKQAEALDAFNDARDVYKNLKKEIKMIQASCFGALIAGDTHFGQYAKLVRKAESRGPISENDSLFKLLRWNVDNEPFW